MSTTFQIKAAILKAINLFASDDETRQILNGVYLDYSKSIPVLLATDGRRLGIYSLDAFKEDLTEAKGQCFLIPSSLIKQIKGSPKAISEWPVNFTFDESVVHMSVAQNGEVQRFTQGTINGNYPNWRQVIPENGKARNVERITVNAEYLADFQKAGQVIRYGKNTYPVMILHSDKAEDAIKGRAVLSIYLSGIPEFYGVLMPCRLDENYTTKIPAFANQN